MIGKIPRQKIGPLKEQIFFEKLITVIQKRLIGIHKRGVVVTLLFTSGDVGVHKRGVVVTFGELLAVGPDSKTFFRNN